MIIWADQTDSKLPRMAPKEHMTDRAEILSQMEAPLDTQAAKHVALRYILDAWEEAVMDGLDPHAMLHAVQRALAACCDIEHTTIQIDVDHTRGLRIQSRLSQPQEAP